ncbi:MAG: hypothetical protein JOZ27_07730 [Caulobacteraceae bacterium]|nr:hypothetical protein [Caulobacteraceae bacterium]
MDQLVGTKVAATPAANDMAPKTADDVIARIEARAVILPLRYPLKTANGVIGASPLVLVDLVTAKGVRGRAYIFTFMPQALEATKLLVDQLGALVAQAPVSPLEIDRRLSHALRLLGRTGIAAMAAAGIDMAAWDAFCVAHEAPLAVMLGGSIRPLPAYDSQGMDGLALGGERADEARRKGFRALKTKLGYATLQEDVDILRALRRAGGDEMDIMVDYNQKLSVPEADRRLAILADEGPYWIEEPTLQEDYAGHARIRASSRVPIQMGENWFGCHEMSKALAAGATDLVMPDVMKIGGVSGWLRAAAAAEQYGAPMSSHLFPEVSAHLLCVTPTAHWLEYMDLAGPVLAGPPVIRDGQAIACSEPGTGLRWDEDAIARYSA